MFKRRVKTSPHGSFLGSSLLLALIAACLLVPAGELRSDEEREQPLEEVFQTELVYPQEEGELQLTLSPRFRSSESAEWLEGGVGVEYGFTDRWQMGLEWDAFVERDGEEGSARGVGDLEIGVKYSAMDAAENLHLAFGLEVAVPLADVDEELTEGLLEVEPFVALARDFPELHDLQLFAQLSLGLVDRVEEPDDPAEAEPAAHELSLNVGAFLPLRHAVVTLELNGSDNTWNRDGEEQELYLTPGVVWWIGEWEAGVGVPIGVGGEADDYRLIVLLTREFRVHG